MVLSLLLQYDTVHGTFAGSLVGDDAAKELIVDGKKIKVCPAAADSPTPCAAFASRES